jgi:hypothetical protein
VRQWPSRHRLAITVVSSAKVVVVDSGEACRSAVYTRHRSGPRTLLWGTTMSTGESSVYSF